MLILPILHNEADVRLHFVPGTALLINFAELYARVLVRVLAE